MVSQTNPTPRPHVPLYLVCLATHHTLISASRAAFMIANIINDISVVSCFA